MSESRKRRELSRADRVLPGLWRLRLPLPWPGVPHARALVAANRREVHERIARVREALADGPRTPFEIVPALMGDAPSQMMLGWGLSEVLCYLRHPELRGEALRQGEDPDRWSLAA